MTTLHLLTLPPSPFNTKVRLALKYKGLSFRSTEVQGFDDREEVIQASGQPLTPVLVDGDKAIYDSFAIMRYLDANFPGPKLFSENRECQQKIQEWERFGFELGGILRLVASQAFNQGIDDAATAKAQAMLDQIPQVIEEALAEQPYLMGEQPNAADFSTATFLRYATVEDPASLPEGPMRFVAERLTLGPQFPKTRAWVQRIMEIDLVAVS